MKRFGRATAAILTATALFVALLPSISPASANEFSAESASWTSGKTITLYGRDYNRYRALVSAGGYTIPSGYGSAGTSTMTIKRGGKTVASGAHSKYLPAGTYVTYNTIPYHRVINRTYQKSGATTLNFLPGTDQGVTCTVTDYVVTTDAAGNDVYTYTADCDATTGINLLLDPNETGCCYVVDGSMTIFSYSFVGGAYDWSIGDSFDSYDLAVAGVEPTPVHLTYNYIVEKTTFGPRLVKRIKRTVIVKKLVRKPVSMGVDWGTGCSYYVNPSAWVVDNYGEYWPHTVKMLLQYNWYGTWHTLQTRYWKNGNSANFSYIYSVASGGWGEGRYRVYAPSLHKAKETYFYDAPAGSC